MVRKIQFWDASVRPTARVESLTVLLAACTLLCFERYITESLLHHTHNMGWQTPKASAALRAREELDRVFPRRLSGTILMAVEAPRNGTVLCPAVEDFVANVTAKVAADERVQQYKPHVLSYWSKLDIPPSVVSRKDFVSEDQRMTLLLIQPTQIPENHNFNQANDFLQEFCSSPPRGFNLHITGAPALATGSGCSSNSHAVFNPRDMNFKCLFFAEVITTPIALLIMGCIVRYWRLLILPVFTVCISFAVSALMLIPWTDHVHVPVDAIAAMGSVILALSLDYSLFLLSRFSENHQDKLTLQENVDVIKANTCQTIAVSGLLVAIAFFAGILLPEKNLQGTCIALGFFVLACVATNVVFLPAVFITLGPMFIGHSFLPSWWGDVKLDDGALDDDEERRPERNRDRGQADNANWLVIMRVVERSPLGAILLVVLLVWPVLSAAPSLHITADRFAMMPLYSPAVVAYRKIQDAKLPVGMVNPYEILVTAPEQPEDVVDREISRGFDDLGGALALKGVDVAILGTGVANAGDATAQQLSAAVAALKEGLNRHRTSVSNAPAEPVKQMNFTEHLEAMLQALKCVNATGSSLREPHCSCCPDPYRFLDCHACEHPSLTCESPEMQVLMDQVSNGNLSVDESHLRMMQDCLERSKVFAVDTSKKLSNKLVTALQASNRSVEKGLLERFPFLADIAQEVQDLSAKPHGMLLLPSGYHALLQLSDELHRTGGVAYMLAPHWILHQRLEWLWAVALAAKPDLRDGYKGFLQHYVHEKQALLQIHTKFPPIGAMSADWAEKARGVLHTWQERHPGYQVQLAGGNAEAADTRDEIMRAMWTYLAVSVSLIMIVLYVSFQSLLVPLRLALALAFTLIATFGMGVLVYQTTLMHWFMPELKYYNGITYEVIPLVTGIAIALGLDYDIFLVSRIVEFRVQRYSDRASIFRGVLKTGDVISGAGLIMSLAFSGLIFSDKIFFQQFGVLIITSVLLDTFVVRTVLVPALMLIAHRWNWWPRVMPPAIHDVLEGEVESCGGLSQPILAQTSLDRMWEGAR